MLACTFTAGGILSLSAAGCGGLKDTAPLPPAAVAQPAKDAPAEIAPVFITAIAMLHGDQDNALKRQMAEGVLALWSREKRPGRVAIVELDEGIGAPEARELAELMLSGNDRATELAAAKGASLLIWGAAAERPPALPDSSASESSAAGADTGHGAAALLLATTVESGTRPCGRSSGTKRQRARLCEVTSSMTTELCASEWAAIFASCSVTQSAE